MDENNGLLRISSLESYEGKTLKETIEGITREKGISRVDAIEMIYNELEFNQFMLIDVNPPKNFLRYFLSSYNISFWVTIIYLSLTFYSINALPQVYPYLHLRHGCTILLTLFIPGFLIMDIITPSNLQEETLLKIGLGVILSFLLVSIVEYMVMSYTFNFGETSILFSLIYIVTIASFILSVKKYLERNVYNDN